MEMQRKEHGNVGVEIYGHEIRNEFKIWIGKSNIYFNHKAKVEQTQNIFIVKLKNELIWSSMYPNVCLEGTLDIFLFGTDSFSVPFPSTP